MTKDGLSARSAAKIAGVIFLWLVVGWVLNFMFVDQKIIAEGKPIETVKNILKHESKFRLGLLNETLFSLITLVLGYLLYVILKHVNKPLAKLAFYVKLAESIGGLIGVFGAFICLQMVNGSHYLTVLTTNQLYDFVGLYIIVRSTGVIIAMIFLGVDFVLFFYLLYQSNYVPKVLSLFGIVSYALIFINAVICIVTPGNGMVLDMVSSFSMVFMFPSVIFEICIGLWLLIKGLDIKKE